MTLPIPDFSCQTLRLFLRARIVARRNVHDEAPAVARRAVSSVIRREARITHAQFDMAVSGRLMAPEVRARIWGALGHDPAEHGVQLVQGGQSHARP